MISVHRAPRRRLPCALPAPMPLQLRLARPAEARRLIMVGATLSDTRSNSTSAERVSRYFSSPCPFGGGATKGDCISPYAAPIAVASLSMRQNVGWASSRKMTPNSLGDNLVGLDSFSFFELEMQAFAELGMVCWLRRWTSHHARTSEETRGGKISGDQRVVSLAHECIGGGSEPKMKSGAQPKVASQLNY